MVHWLMLSDLRKATHPGPAWYKTSFACAEVVENLTGFWVSDPSKTVSLHKDCCNKGDFSWDLHHVPNRLELSPHAGAQPRRGGFSSGRCSKLFVAQMFCVLAVCHGVTTVWMPVLVRRTGAFILQPPSHWIKRGQSIASLIFIAQTHLIWWWLLGVIVLAVIVIMPSCKLAAAMTVDLFAWFWVQSKQSIQMKGPRHGKFAELMT